jgi:WhiB family transcriptional regulator, redox-sensing transcriptional regulator
MQARDVCRSREGRCGHRRLLPRSLERDWQLRARCRGLATELFFASEQDKGARQAEREQLAKAVCRSCPVRRHCLAHALKTNEAYGIWGATTPTERRRLIAEGATLAPWGQSRPAEADPASAGSRNGGVRTAR